MAATHMGYYIVRVSTTNTKSPNITIGFELNKEKYDVLKDEHNFPTVPDGRKPLEISDKEFYRISDLIKAN